MEKQIIECVPNFSEGRDIEVINAITDAMQSVGGGVKLLDVDPGEATNRTVVTIAGDPQSVVEAAFRGISTAARLIDMSKHHGAHPRMGATDVCPLIPVSGITLEECAVLATSLAERVASELNIPVYLYEASAKVPERKNLAVCRKGEYEALAERMSHPDQMPDLGTRPWDAQMARTGATAIGARDFLIAVNFNLNSTSTRRANAIAFDVREKGRPLREGGLITGKPLKDRQGNTLMQPGTLKGTKAIGWYIDEYGIAQVSMNITDISTTPLHRAFDEVSRAAATRGLRVTGAEIVGLIPKRVLIDAGKHYLHLQQRSSGLPDAEIIRIAVKSMGLDDLKPFNPDEKVIESLLSGSKSDANSLISLSARGLAEKTASEAPAPGGGSIAAYMGALSAALATMVANLSAHKAGWDDRWKEFSDLAEAGQSLMERLLRLVDEDTRAFNAIMAAIQMPKATETERQIRAQAMEEATHRACLVPLATAQASLEAFPLLKEAALKGLPASVTDAGTGAAAARAAVCGAMLNVKVNAASLADRAEADRLCLLAAQAYKQASELSDEILTIVEEKI